MGGIAAPLILRNGPSRRPLIRWIARATSSFPVPVSPVIRTEKGDAAAFSITFRTSSQAGEPPTIPNHSPAGALAPSRSTASDVATALPTTRSSSASSNGLEM